jgi:Domain of unknown function (DUF4129)
VLVLAAHLPLQAQAPIPHHAPLSLGTYIAELDRLSAFLTNATPVDAEKISAGIAPRWVVDTGSDRVAVDTRWLVSGLREATMAGDAWNANRERLRRRLLEMRTHATAVSATGTSDPSHQVVRAAVQNVLAREEFQQTAGARWREQLQQRFGKWIQSIASGLGLGGFGGRRLAIAVAWVAAMAALAGLAFWLTRALVAGSRSVSFGLARSERNRLSARDWALRAIAALQGGDAREGIRLAYNGALRRMEEQGVWRLDQSRTPREYLRMLRPDDGRGAPVTELTELFEQVWYGNRPIAEDASHRVSANLERLGCLQPGDRPI